MNIIGRYTSRLIIKILFCNNHGETRFGLSGTKRPRWKCLECSSDTSYLYKKRKKIKSIEYKGGCCIQCGFNQCISALHFHHINPETKSFDINQGITKKWDLLKDELDKCILLCMNCHFMEHERIDTEQRNTRKKNMVPKKFYNRKEINILNCETLGIRHQP